MQRRKMPVEETLHHDSHKEQALLPRRESKRVKKTSCEASSYG